MPNQQSSSNSSNAPSETYRIFMGARVKWPPEVPDDILEACILETQSALKKFDVSKDGQKVLFIVDCIYLIYLI